MKKLAALALAMVMIFSLAACSKSDDGTGENGDTPLFQREEGANIITGYKPGDVTLGEYKGVKYTPMSTEVTEEEIQERLVSDVIAQYQTYAAMRAAADSYGGINSKAVYLNPSSTLADVAQQVGGNGGSGQSGNGGGTNPRGGPGSITGGGSDNGSGNTGGGTTGGESTTVAAPQFSGGVHL